MEGKLPNSLSRGRVTLVIKPERDTAQKTIANILKEYGYKYSPQYT